MTVLHGVSQGDSRCSLIKVGKCEEFYRIKGKYGFKGKKAGPIQCKRKTFGYNLCTTAGFFAGRKKCPEDSVGGQMWNKVKSASEGLTQHFTLLKWSPSQRVHAILRFNRAKIEKKESSGRQDFLSK